MYFGKLASLKQSYDSQIRDKEEQVVTKEGNEEGTNRMEKRITMREWQRKMIDI